MSAKSCPVRFASRVEMYQKRTCLTNGPGVGVQAPSLGSAVADSVTFQAANLNTAALHA
jgi:hypothetical protein